MRRARVGAVGGAAVARGAAAAAAATAAAALVLLGVLGARVASAQIIPRSVAACGGDVAAGPAHTVVGTIGQPLVGRSTGPGEPATHACSGWWCGEFGTVVAVAPSGPQAPRVTRMAPPAPNPGSGPVRLAYDLARDARVEIAVYAVNGARVRSLVREARPAGRHETWWDGRAGDGEPAGSGIYFVVLRVNGEPAGRRRIVLVR